jgi:iron complex outermembrane receptor protein
MRNPFTQKKRAILTGLAEASAITAAPSFAQLEEVVVTAERREASVQDVPIAVSAYGEELIENLQLDDTLDLINVVPNMFGGNNTGLATANMYYIRAQGNDESISTFDPPVGTYVDDVYITRQNANNFALFDVERIEVLRGPQGTLYGRNTTGGAISVVMKKPGDTAKGFIEVGAGSFGKHLVRASLDMPLSDKVLSKISVFDTADDGYLKNLANGKKYNNADMTGFRVALRVLPTDTVTWDIALDTTDIEATAIHGFIDGDDRISTSKVTSGLPANFDQKSDYGNEVKTLNITSNLAWDVAGGTANLIIGNREIEQDFLLNFPIAPPFPDFFLIDNNGEHDMFSAELKWSGNIMNDRVYLSTGMYYMDEDNTVDFADYLDLAAVGVPVPPSTVFTALADRVLSNGTESFAVYAQADIKIGDNGTLTLGARYTDEEKTFGYSGSITNADLDAAGVPRSQDEQKVTPRIAYSHAVNDDMMIYASITNGFKSGGWNARESVAATALPFGPEEIWAYEAGIRADWMDGRLRTNITAFYSDLEDLQTTSAYAGDFLTTNAGGLEVTGLEAEITALPTDNWQIFAAIGLQDPKYVDLAGGCVTPNNDLAAYNTDCSVADPKRSPEETYTIGTAIDIPMGSFTVTPTAMARYIGENVTGTRGTGINDAVTLVNAGIKITDASDQWQLQLECKNCTDKEYVTSFLFVNYYNAPRTYMATLKYNFGQ